MNSNIRQQQAGSSSIQRNKKKLSHRSRHRLESIRHDVQRFRATKRRFPQSLPLVANERCGIWYAYPFLIDNQNKKGYSCYFKSTDGHRNVWNVSLKRLNLNMIQIVADHGACLVVDSSMRKKFPDSFARTIPIWAAVMNRVAQMYRRDLKVTEPNFWDNSLHITTDLVPEEEKLQIESLLETRARDLYNSKAIVDPKWLVETLQKPLRSVPIPLDGNEMIEMTNDEYYTIFCFNMSQVSIKGTYIEESNCYYTPGAADDHESWSRHLTPRLFWENVDVLFEGCIDDDEFDMRVDSLVQLEQSKNPHQESFSFLNEQSPFDWIGNTGIAIGTRRAGRPPECWKNFDAVLNVTEMEYEGFNESGDGRSYLQCPIKEGKKDKTELEKWLPVGILFIWWHRKHGKSVLVHCAQGMDRSVAFVMATVIIFCELEFPLKWKKEAFQVRLEALFPVAVVSGSSHPLYRLSELPSELVENLMADDGKDTFLQWLHSELCHPTTVPLASKETLRVVLHLVGQDREKADPSRATMQKLNRFFMSSNLYRSAMIRSHEK